MNSYLNLLTEKIFDLYTAYEDYAFSSYVKDENKYKLVVTFTDNNSIHFAMFEKNSKHEFELLDEIYISFEEERELYEAISLRLFVKALGNVMIHKLDNNMYFNAIHKSYVLVIAKDKEVNDMFDNIIVNQENEIISLDNEIIEKKAALVRSKKCNNLFLCAIEIRAKMTREILRSGKL